MGMEVFLAYAQSSTMEQYYQRCREAGQHHAEEQQAAMVLQACWRGHQQRQELERLRLVAVTIQKCWRGYLGRRRCAAALAAHNTQLRQAYFNHHATTIQKCWRGHYSRSHIHDFYKRKAFLQSVAAANAAVRAGMDEELQSALTYQQQEARAKAKSQFEAQVSKLHYLSSTASIPGIFKPPAGAAGAGGQQACFSVAGQPLEQHLVAAVRHKARVVARQQQTALKRMMGNTQQGGGMFPAGVPQLCSSSSKTSRGGSAQWNQAAAAGAQLESCDVGVAATAVYGQAAASPCQHHARSTSTTVPAAYWSSSSCGPQQQTPLADLRAGMRSGGSPKQGSSSRGSLKSLHHEQKLAHKIVESCVDQVFAAKAAANMADGSFNPGLSLQQSTSYEAAKEAADLDRRLERGLMLVLHKGQPFIPVLGKHELASNKPADSSAEQPPSTQLACSDSDTGPRVCSSPEERMHFWRHNKHSGGMFSKHLKQLY